VHGNAELAVVGVVVQRMDVRYLDNSKQRQQGHAQQSGCPASAWLPAAFRAAICLRLCQQIISCFKDTQYWTRKERGWFQSQTDFAHVA
jgi:hypothetical protein